MHRTLAAGLVAVAAIVSPATAQGTKPTFVLTSTDIRAGQQIPAPQVFGGGMGCTGGNISPALAWTGAPAATKSFAVTVYDPDAPTGSGWWHWVVYNIPATVKKIPAGAGSTAPAQMPAGAKQGNTDFGTPGYGGPCPPVGSADHHYIFTIYALDVASLDVPATATAAYVGFNIHGHTIGQATFTSLYKR